MTLFKIINHAPTAAIPLLFLITPVCVMAEAPLQIDNDSYDQCLLKALKSASPEQTVEEITQQCHSKTRNPIDKRIRFEKEVANNPFAITPHRPNFLMPFTYAENNRQPYKGTSEDNDFDNIETVFQVSLKYSPIEDFLIDGLDFQFAFTSISWWQTYNSDNSSPFRETNYEPEILLTYQKPWHLFSLPIERSYIALNHESNGKSGDLSRSWNRVIGGMSFNKDNLTLDMRAWWRIPENGLNDAGRPVDDNPDIDRYLGNGDISLIWQFSDDLNLSMMLRNNLRRDNKGAIKLGLTFPFNKHLKGYVEYFNGYGESLIYYNEHMERIGVGIKLTDWL